MPLPKTLVKGGRRWMHNDYVSPLAMCTICATVDYMSSMAQREGSWYCEDCQDEPNERKTTARSAQLSRR